MSNGCTTIEKVPGTFIGAQPPFGEDMTLDLQTHETELRGEWIACGKKVVGDTACERIEWLTSSCLVRLASDASGWETLYRDPRTGRLWERTYPHSEWHGGGPPMLRAISLVDAQAKYVTFALG